VPIVLFYDAAVVPAESNSWESATPPLVRLRWELVTDEPQSETTVPIMPDGPDTFYVRTRSDTYCLMQVLGFSDDPRCVRIRYKLVLGGANPAAVDPEQSPAQSTGVATTAPSNVPAHEATVSD
jgi:hypothetical protein